MAETGQNAFVMDASAIVALLDREQGFERVAAVLGKSAMSTVNLAEVQSRAALQGHDPDAIALKAASTQVGVREAKSARPIMWPSFSPRRMPGYT